jgi:tyrosinase
MWAYPFNFMGDIPYTNITVDTQLEFAQLLPKEGNITIRDTMDILAKRFCYTYQ